MLRRRFWLSWRGTIAIAYLYFVVPAILTLCGSYIIMLMGGTFKYDFLGSWRDFALLNIAGIPYMMLLIRPFQHAFMQRKNGLNRHVIAHRCQICPGCLYDLRGRDCGDDTCPECGQIVSRRECVRLWGKYMLSF